MSGDGEQFNLNLTELLIEKSTAVDSIENNDIRRHIAAVEFLCNASQSSENVPGTHCPKIFDGWSCWDETPAGHTAFTNCPWFIPGFDSSLKAHKQCENEGVWFRHPQSNNTWSNYTTCIDYDAFSRYKTVVTIYEIGYLISLCALIASLVIFCAFRSLQCTRVLIHKHLFGSFITNNCLWLIWYRFVVNESRPVNELNQPFCTSLHILVHYFMLANYFWMFCEGLYLHTLLVYAFNRAEKILLRFFYFFGWLGPLFPIAFYSAFRAFDDEERGNCWINESRYSYFLSVPVCICLVVSLLFLVNILRVLLVKLNARSTFGRRDSAGESTVHLRKAARATLILIPLLGVHYFITPFQPDPQSSWAVYYDYFAAVSASLQGLAVSLLFCFCNGEVLSALRRRFVLTKSSDGCGPGGGGHGRTVVTTKKVVLEGNKNLNLLV